MGRSSVNAEVRPNVRLGSARQHVTIRPKFGRTSAKIRRHLRLCFRGILPVLMPLFCGPAGVNLNPLLIICYQLVTNLPVGIQLLDDDDDVQWFNVHIKAN